MSNGATALIAAGIVAVIAAWSPSWAQQAPPDSGKMPPDQSGPSNPQIGSQAQPSEIEEQQREEQQQPQDQQPPGGRSG